MKFCINSKIKNSDYNALTNPFAVTIILIDIVIV